MELTAASLNQAATDLLNSRRSPLSPKAAWPPLSYMDAHDRFYSLIAAICHGATVEATAKHEGGGSRVRTTIYHGVILAPNISHTIQVQGATPEEAVKGLNKRWAQARREYDTARVLEQCIRLSSGNMTDTQRATLQEKLLATPQDQFENLAAKARKQAQSLAGETEHSQEYWASRPAA